MEKQPTSPRKNKMPPEGFDPFNDRLSRDIRNSLSEAFVDALEIQEPSGYQAVAAKWLAGKPGVRYRTYIQDRLHRYDGVMNLITTSHLDDTLLQSLVLWNNCLFFEFHDHLERIWRQTKGDERQALKGLIKAAGVYIHMEHNHRKAVERLSEKSHTLLNRYARCLTFISNLNELMESLKNLDPISPRLENPGLRAG